MNRVLMLEFNELSPDLMDRFIADGHLPAFKRLRDRSATFITEARESEDRLNPWVQWVTVHTGVPASVHGIRKLGEAHKLAVPTIGEVVSAAGGRVWLCGSMNVQPSTPIDGAVLPDPWSVDATPQPTELEPFFRFVSANVQEHTSGQQPLTKKELAAFVGFMARHGLAPSTLAATVRQLVGERMHRAPRGRRAEILDRFQWDVFRHYFRRIQPHFATFFSNSTAHFQHLHWDELDGDQDGSEVLHGYRQMDRLVAEALELAGADVAVGLCTALSQTSNRDDDTYRGFYRPAQLDQFAAQLRVRGCRSTSPVMAEQFHLLFDTERAATDAEQWLVSAVANDAMVFDVRRSRDDLLVGCRFTIPQPQGMRLMLGDGTALPFDDVFYWTDAPRQGTHHPDGLFWLRTDHGDRSGRVALETVAPTVLSVLGVDPPATMVAGPAGALAT